MAGYHKTVLENGLRILTIPQVDSVAATILVLVEAGSKYEVKELNGISHFFEHMCFKGTALRPRPGMIAEELAALGAQSNAFTSQEFTGYYVKVAKRHFDKALEIVSDLYLNPLFNPEEIAKERGVVIEEINMHEDIPQHKVQRLMLELLYGDQPAGWDVAGRKEVIQKITQADFLNYRKEHYVARATTVAVAGSFDEQGAIENIKGHFRGISGAEKSGKPRTIEAQNEPALLVHKKDSDQTHLVIAARAFDMFDERRFALQVLSDVLGGGMSSRLFHKVRDELGAAYYVYSSPDLSTDHGVLGIAAGVDHKKIKEVLQAILAECARLSQGPVPEKELQKSKDHLSGSLLLDLETSDQLASYYGSQEIVEKKIIAPDELIAKIQAVSATEVGKVAGDIFKDEKLNLALIGPFEGEAEFRELLHF
ncbi:MAG: pitrilysin family protein [bacterium]|nr:pitrilysin family protein [bacterium]